MRMREPNPFMERRRARGVFDVRTRGTTRDEARTIQRFREHERARFSEHAEHLHSVTDLHAYLEERGHTDACAHVYRCDPWKYEPILLDDLIAERVGANDPVRINALRGLIRAGSWMTYEPVTESDVQRKLSDIQRREEADWMSRVRRSDPDTAKELLENMEEQREEFERVRRAIHEGVVGETLEDAVRTIENFNAFAWTEAKKTLAAKGLAWQDARRDPAVRPLIEEIEKLRAVRDLLYFRRIYPSWAAESVGRRRKKAKS